jgi:TonB family protein
VSFQRVIADRAYHMRMDGQIALRSSRPRSEPLLFLTLTLAIAALAVVSPAYAGENVPPHASADRSGEITTSDRGTFTLTTDLGSVRIQTLPATGPPVIHYTVHIETDAAEPVAHALLQKYVLTAKETPNGVSLVGRLPQLRSMINHDAQYWVQFQIGVPANFGVEVSTGAGDIETSDLAGHVVLKTQGGNIRTGRLGFALYQMVSTERYAAKLETQGGHITVLDVAGDLDAFTAGGHIQAGNVSGSAKLRSGGGHIRAGQIGGEARLETEGGNIAVGEAGSFVSVRTGGGQIDFGEVHGSVRAQSAGGGIRMMYVTGPMEVETSGGSICLTHVANTLRAATGNGRITAWIAPDSPDPKHPVRLLGASQLSSSTGDIVVFLPRNIMATIDATVDNGGAQRLEADPSLPLNLQMRPEGSLHAYGTLNGGGAVLKLHTTAGKIRLQYLDTETTLRQSMMDEEKQRLVNAGFPKEAQRQDPRALVETTSDAKVDWIAQWIDWLESKFMGGMREDAEEFKKRLIASPSPEYPQLARKAGLQGVVRMQVRVNTDGSLSVDKIIEGEPALADAATSAIRQWRARPGQLGDKKVDVITTVTFNFQLH